MSVDRFEHQRIATQRIVNADERYTRIASMIEKLDEDDPLRVQGEQTLSLIAHSITVLEALRRSLERE